MKRIVQKKFEEKLNYLLKQKLRYNGELITLTIHVTILTYLILILLYIYRCKSCRWGITDRTSPSMGLWHKAMLEHINVLGLKAIKIWIYTYCKNKDVKVMVWQCHSCQLCQQYGGQNLKLAIILPTEYGIFVLKTNSGLQQHTHQEQSILRQISNLEH